MRKGNEAGGGGYKEASEKNREDLRLVLVGV